MFPKVSSKLALHTSMIKKIQLWCFSKQTMSISTALKQFCPIMKKNPIITTRATCYYQYLWITSNYFRQKINTVISCGEIQYFVNLCLSFLSVVSGALSELCVHHVPVEERVVPATLCLCLQMGTHQGKGQAPHAQPSHQQSKWGPSHSVSGLALIKTSWLDRSYSVFFSMLGFFRLIILSLCLIPNDKTCVSHSLTSSWKFSSWYKRLQMTFVTWDMAARSDIFPRTGYPELGQRLHMLC